jgi:glycosyltransferase involved in cell wall biosynthesis
LQPFPLGAINKIENAQFMKIGILSQGFTGWGGGIDFIRYMLSYLDEEQKTNPDLHKTLFLPKDNFLEKLKKISYPVRNLLKQFKKRRALRWEKRPGFSSSYLQNTYKSFSKSTDIVLAGSNFNAQLRSAISAGSDVVFPCMDVPDKSFSLPWVGYLFDFQHRYYPEFFSKDEIQSRNNAFEEMLFKAQHIVVNGRAVINDAKLFYPEHTAKLHALPFCPCPMPHWLDMQLDVRGEYEITRPYFLVCNQFWKHKDHRTAFLAFKEYCDRGGNALLICTGSTDDFRFPEYFQEISHLINELNLIKKIRILGHIPKDDQISLMKNALSVIQPTLFEGGPGGGASYEAISLGIPVIASDIPINKEMNCGEITFFTAGNPTELANIMLKRGEAPPARLDNKALLAQGIERRKNAGIVLYNVFLEAIKDRRAN